MKILPGILTVIFFFSCCVYSQTADKIHLQIAAVVTDFDTSGAVVSSSFPGEADIKNGKGDVLRFKINENNELQSYHGSIAFILYDFEKGWLGRISTYGSDGKLKGDSEFDDIAVLELEIVDLPLLHVKFEKLDEADGNLNMNDADMKVVYQRTFTSKRQLIKEGYINTPEYWKMNRLLYRP